MRAKDWSWEEGVTGGSERNTRGERGTGVTPAPLSQKRGLWGEGWGSHHSFWLVPCEALCFLPLGFEGLCFTRKQWQWPQLAQPSAASKLAAARKDAGVGGGSDERESKAIVRGSEHVQNARSFRPLMLCLCPPWESGGGTEAPLSCPPPPFTASFFFCKDEWIFQKRQPIVFRNRQRLSQFYGAFPEWGGSLSAAIENHCHAARTPFGCPGNIVVYRKRRWSSQPYTYQSCKHLRMQHGWKQWSIERTKSFKLKKGGFQKCLHNS